MSEDNLWLNTKMNEMEDTTPPAGEYVFTVISWKPKVQADGKPFANVALKPTEAVNVPDLEGKEDFVSRLDLVFEKLYGTTAAQKFTADWLGRIGGLQFDRKGDVDFKNLFEQLVGRQVRAVLSYEQGANGKTYSKMNWLPML